MEIIRDSIWQSLIRVLKRAKRLCRVDFHHISREFIFKVTVGLKYMKFTNVFGSVKDVPRDTEIL